METFQSGRSKQNYKKREKKKTHLITDMRCKLFSGELYSILKGHKVTTEGENIQALVRCRTLA